LKEIYASGELAQDPTLRKVLRVQREGSREVRREIELYNLDAIISVGYRVNSAQATQFRIWATQTEFESDFEAQIQEQVKRIEAKHPRKPKEKP